MIPDACIQLFICLSEQNPTQTQKHARKKGIEMQEALNRTVEEQMEHEKEKRKSLRSNFRSVSLVISLLIALEE